MPSPWIQHVKKYASDHNITYKEALKLSKPSYSVYGTVSTDPSMIKFNLNDDQYNLSAFNITPIFRKGDKSTHNVNVKYKSDETINKESKRQREEYIERPESNIYNVEGIIEPTKTRNKFIINDLKHNKNISKINAKYEKIKNTDMSKYLNQRPVMKKPNKSTKNDGFSFLYEPEKVEIPKLSFSAPFKKYFYEEGIVPYTNIIIPKFNSPDEEINIYNTIITKYKNLITVLNFLPLPENDKKTLMYECGVNINALTDKILKIQEEQVQREQPQIGMNDINVSAKPIKTREIPTLKSDFTSLKEMKDYFSIIFNNIENKSMDYEEMNVPQKEINILLDKLNILYEHIKKYYNGLVSKEPTKTRNKFIINNSKYKNQINKLTAKYEKIKNTDMSKYLNKKNEERDNMGTIGKYLNKKISTKKNKERELEETIDKLINSNNQLSVIQNIFSSFDEMKNYYDELYRKITERQEAILGANKLIETNESKILFRKYYDLKELLKNNLIATKKKQQYEKKLLRDAKKQQREQPQIDINELKELEDIEINKIAQNKKIYDTSIKALKSKFETAQNKKNYDTSIKALKSKFEKASKKTQIPTIQALLNSDNPTSLLKSNFKTKKDQRDYFSIIYKNIEKKRSDYDDMDIPKEEKILKDNLQILLHTIDNYKDKITLDEIDSRQKQDKKQ